MILHTLNIGPDTGTFTECLRMATSDDALLLTGDGVYASIKNTSACNLLVESGAELYILVCAQVTLIDYDDFVGLSERFARQLAWY